MKDLSKKVVGLIHEAITKAQQRVSFIASEPFKIVTLQYRL